MKHFLTIVIVFVIAIVVFITVDWNGIDLSSAVDTSYNKLLKSDTSSDSQIELDEDLELWRDTVMYAKGHAFGYSGDLSMWGGWYLDTVYVGNDLMLTYDSVGPTLLKLSLVTRELIVDLEDSDVINKIKNFMNPIDGFKRFSKCYEECLDSLYYEGYGYDEYMGNFSFEVDYADSCNENAGKINRFTCELTGLSENEKSNIPSLSAFYAGVKPIKYYRQIYTGNDNDMQCLSDFLAHKTFENWKLGGDFGMGSSAATLAIRPHIANERYVTFSKYEYEREGIGHGMYTQTFHTFNMKSGKELSNKDIFKSQSLDKVKMNLFEVIAQDPHYLAWHGGSVLPSDVGYMIEAWKSPNPILKGTEWEAPEKEDCFELPDGALTKLGVVFSFQPYEIDCWAAGAYHFIVPYNKLMPYLTPEVKSLISDSNLK
ncbi:MAG: DUF3298 domain-containing protein [Bacteroides sp.]|nr:DUF3298 domain-containing protein [Bacteroides sp.]